jgi:hypothetical protein
MRKLTATLGVLALFMAIGAGNAQADYGLSEFDATYNNADGSPITQAGAHPFAQSTNVVFNRHGEVLDGDSKDVLVKLPPGFAGQPSAMPTCKTADFITIIRLTALPNCSDGTVLGVAEVEFLEPGPNIPRPIYNLPPSPGEVSKLGFYVYTTPVIVDVGVNPEPPYNVEARATEASTQVVPVFSTKLTLWGVPASPAHDGQRGFCSFHGGKCPVALPEVPFITMPRSCHGPLLTTYASDSWQNPGAFLASGQPDLSDPAWVTGQTETHDEAEPPQPLGTTGCGRLAFDPTTSAAPTSKAATSPTGLDFDIDMKDEGFSNPAEGATAAADIEKAVVTLPEGMSVNASIAEGLAVCTEADVARETPFSQAGAGCPSASKIGSLEAQTPQLPGVTLYGSLYQAAPYANPEHSLIALYVVIKDATRGINVIQPLKVETDPNTGRITTVSEDMPQVPLSHIRFHFREGTRSPLATPSACGTYSVQTSFYPSSGGAPAHPSSSFEVISGPGGAPCPKGGLPPFHPELSAGTLNNAAASFSPFNVKITRTDSEQEINHFSIKLPPGVAGKLAGIPFCSDAAIAQAKARTGPHGGQEELASPSCPAASQVGRTLAGAGVGPSLAYAPGKIYLAGPYHGSPISFVSITSGVVGPFDIGTVVVRLAIRVNPETGEVFLDSVGSDPIPHIIHGIPVHLRDIRAYTDRPDFTFNPTSCARKQTAATVLGSGLDFVSEADDNPFVSTSPFQAADCAALPFKPKLSFKLLGGTKRGAYPKLKAFLRMNGFGEAGVAKARVTLPKSEFIANAHFNTICTRVQFKEAGGNGEACPANSIYGWARAKSPILSDPLEGPIFLRSSEHQLPDLVASLRGQEIDVHLVGRVDSVKGRLRNTFETVPDAPVEWASFSFQGQKKGLFENSTDLCKGTHKAKVELSGQNGKEANYGAPLQVNCGGKAKRQKSHKKARR